MRRAANGCVWEEKLPAQPLQTHPEHTETASRPCRTRTLLSSAVGAAVAMMWLEKRER